MIDDLKIVVNGPKIIYDNNESNNSSLIVSITDKENKFLFMGDSQNARIKDFLSENQETYNFLKIPYHGNYSKRLNDLLENTKVKDTVITCSSKEGCDNETIDTLDKYGIKYYLTKNGSITIISDGTNIIINQ